MIYDVTQDPMKKRLRLILGAIFFALLFISTGVNMYRGLAVLSVKSEPGWVANQIGSRLFIVQVAPHLASTLQFGDEIISLNREPIKDPFDIIRVFQNTLPGQTYQIEIRRNGQARSFTLESVPILTADWVAMVARYLLIPAIFIITGFVVFLLKPHDKQARLLALMFGMFIGALSATTPCVRGRAAVAGRRNANGPDRIVISLARLLPFLPDLPRAVAAREAVSATHVLSLRASLDNHFPLFHDLEPACGLWQRKQLSEFCKDILRH